MQITIKKPEEAWDGLWRLVCAATSNLKIAYETKCKCKRIKQAFKLCLNADTKRNLEFLPAHLRPKLENSLQKLKKKNFTDSLGKIERLVAKVKQGFLKEVDGVLIKFKRARESFYAGLESTLLIG